MPTFSASAGREGKGLGVGINILDRDGRLAPEPHAAPEVIKTHNMGLAAGPVSTADSIAVKDNPAQLLGPLRNI